MKNLDLLPKHIPRKYHGNFHAGTVHFQWAPLGDNLARWLLKKLEDLKSLYLKDQSSGLKRHGRKRTSLLVVNALAYNVVRKSIRSYFKSFQQLTKRVKHILDNHDDDHNNKHDDDDDDDVDDDQCDDHSHKHDDDEGDDDNEKDDDGDDDDDTSKNIRIIYLSTVPPPKQIYFTKALSKITLRMMHSVGVEAFDLMPMLHSVYDKTVDGTHYMTVTPSTGKVHGEFGPGVADAIINYICS